MQMRICGASLGDADVAACGASPQGFVGNKRFAERTGEQDHPTPKGLRKVLFGKVLDKEINILVNYFEIGAGVGKRVFRDTFMLGS